MNLRRRVNSVFSLGVINSSMSPKDKIMLSYDCLGKRISFQKADAIKTPTLLPESRRALISQKYLHAKIFQDSKSVLNINESF